MNKTEIKRSLESVFNLQEKLVNNWHEKEDYDLKTNNELIDLIILQSSFNFRLWHQEDIARSKDVNDSKIAEVKKNIDKLNQSRNDHIEKIDDFLIDNFTKERINLNSFNEFNSETIGSIIDKMSIMALKVFHMSEQVKRNDVPIEHKKKCEEKLAKLKVQREDLNSFLIKLLEDIYNEKRGFKIYKQYKMYNDPSLNPELYKNKAK